MNPQTLSGATRLHYIVGDPIAQVKSPAGVSQAFAERGHQAVCVPAHVAPQDLAAWARGVSLAQNVDGIIVTVPHKFACVPLCASLSERASFLGAVNTLRRNPDGTWHGDMFDGLGFVQAMRAQQCEPAGRKVLLVGAGGAGSAIAHALVMADVSELALHDPDVRRRDGLIARLASLGRGEVRVGNADPRGFDIVINASPIGMREGDPYPLDVDLLQPRMFCGCVITAPAITPFIAAARAKKCATLTGTDMFLQVRGLMVDFLLGA
ncbi:shikimate dehydrogenase [Hydrogenophaga sp.]|uniref:shikimate dehydrogenase family protein n=1 Tax=Hydrogenophaga sp. TaxID=1904254 RepID=UPI00262877EA|nr:shikimate dehydrogenase [Hydrogenophaga sp.]MCW5652537.1 shikimate dehydrogenase [Hydrogenophaga sp.]